MKEATDPTHCGAEASQCTRDTDFNFGPLDLGPIEAWVIAGAALVIFVILALVIINYRTLFPHGIRKHRRR